MRRPDATLDSAKNNCWMVVTDGDELKNNQIYSVARSSVAVIFGALKGKPLTRWLGEYLWLRILEQSGGVESVGRIGAWWLTCGSGLSGAVTSIREQVSMSVERLSTFRKGSSVSGG